MDWDRVCIMLVPRDGRFRCAGHTKMQGMAVAGELQLRHMDDVFNASIRESGEVNGGR